MFASDARFSRRREYASTRAETMSIRGEIAQKCASCDKRGATFETHAGSYK